MIYLPSPSPEELAREALEIFKNHPMTPEEGWEFLIRQGIIDHNGRVICQKLFGGPTEQEPPAVPDQNGQ